MFISKSIKSNWSNYIGWLSMLLIPYKLKNGGSTLVPSLILFIKSFDGFNSNKEFIWSPDSYLSKDAHDNSPFSGYK